MSLEGRAEGVERLRRTEVRRERVPNGRCGERKRAAASLRVNSGDDELVKEVGTKGP